MNLNAAEQKKAEVLPRVQVVSETPGRLRVKILDHMERRNLEHLASTIASWPGIRQVVASSLTKTVLLFYEGPSDWVWAKARHHKLFDRVPTAVNASPKKLHRQQSATQSGHDKSVFAGLLGTTLLGLAALQATRGKFLPAGLTLIFQASEFLKPKPPPTPAGHLEPLSEGL